MFPIVMNLKEEGRGEEKKKSPVGEQFVLLKS